MRLGRSQYWGNHVFTTEDAGRVSDEVLWLLADHQGTIRDVVDSFGTLRKHVEYDSFGKFCEEPTPYTLGGGQGSQWFFDREGELIADPAASAEAVDQLFYYTGREWDAGSYLYNYRARWYDPAAGRWLSEDPSGFDSGDANLYRYVGNSPLNFTDPTGLRQSGNPLEGILRDAISQLNTAPPASEVFRGPSLPSTYDYNNLARQMPTDGDRH